MRKTRAQDAEQGTCQARARNAGGDDLANLDSRWVGAGTLSGRKPPVPQREAACTLREIGMVAGPTHSYFFRIAAWELTAHIVDTLLHAPLPGLVRQVHASGLSPRAVRVGMQKREPRSSDADSLLGRHPIHEEKDFLPPVCCPRTLLGQAHSSRIGHAIHQLDDVLCLLAGVIVMRARSTTPPVPCRAQLRNLGEESSHPSSSWGSLELRVCSRINAAG